LGAGFIGVEICSEHRKPPLRRSRVRYLPEQSLQPGQSEPETGMVEKARGTMADSREVMNIRQASQYLGVSPDTLYKYVGEQRIPAFKLGNRWRFKKSRLDQWMEEKSSEMEPQAKRKPKAATKAAGS
jgi:excisionase family DNA binding protein